jgi:fatty-acyl-CoA synthase
MAKWWLPDAVVHVDSLPRTGTGKYQKHVVRATYKDYFAEATLDSNLRTTA